MKHGCLINIEQIERPVKRYTQTSVYLGILLILINLVIYLLSIPAGLLLTCFILIYFALVLSMQFYNKPVILNEMVSFATQYGQIQKVLLQELETPMPFWMMKGM